ncbi:acetoin utilization protein AcuC [Actinocorallia longicatena]|uniref:Acetoin utilization protein AcuC n=1 Tax=Actinocorallia longicatena TaxID=111803 RepID=A0ABP6QNI2_9ACTN
MRVYWDDKLLSYDFGPSHPLNPVRVELTMKLAERLGVLEHVELHSFEAAGDGLISLVHDRAYVEAVKRAGDTLRAEPAFGLGTMDNPIFAGMHEASSLVVGATVAAARAVWEGETEHAANISGGLHHAMPASAAGFCIYNDPAVAIAWLLEHGASRVAYVDVDVHHGDGVQEAFYDDPRVLTISLHESPRTLFPGTGYPHESGADGTSVNVALPPGTTDEQWLRAFHGIVPPLLRAFEPEILITQQGCDGHRDDPLAHLSLTVDGQRAVYRTLHDLAHETAGGKWVLTGGGGYELVQVVPRAWTHLLAVAAHAPLDPATACPEEWREFARNRTGEIAPKVMTDGAELEVTTWGKGFDPANPIDQAVLATRRAVFPEHGLDPLLD